VFCSHGIFSKRNLLKCWPGTGDNVLIRMTVVLDQACPSCFEVNMLLKCPFFIKVKIVLGSAPAHYRAEQYCCRAGGRTAGMSPAVRAAYAAFLVVGGDGGAHHLEDHVPLLQRGIAIPHRPVSGSNQVPVPGAGSVKFQVEFR